MSVDAPQWRADLFVGLRSNIGSHGAWCRHPVKVPYAFFQGLIKLALARQTGCLDYLLLGEGHLHRGLSFVAAGT